jgi:hypothetical protein
VVVFRTWQVKVVPMKFTIRELFLLTLVVAACLGWIVDRQRVSAKLRKVSDEVELWRNGLNPVVGNDLTVEEVRGSVELQRGHLKRLEQHLNDMLPNPYDPNPPKP